MDASHRILDIFAEGGGALYLGEKITQLEHALQTAHLAVGAEAPDSLVVAALLHDVGHLLHVPAHDSDGDAEHERLGGDWLARWFGPQVVEPVALHVLAKRYLCFKDSSYSAGLSVASRRSLILQGGDLTREEVVSFESSPFRMEALLLRQWDDRAKVVGCEVPGLADYRGAVVRCLL